MTGTKWDVVVVLGWLGELIAAIVMLAAVYWTLTAIINRAGPAARTT